MKSSRLTKYQISAVVNYLLGTELSIVAALHHYYIEAAEGFYYANELDSVSQYFLEERIFKCAVCNLWSKMFERASKSMPNGETPACEVCLMSRDDIFNSDSHFLRACGIRAEVLTVTGNLWLCPDMAMTPRPRPDGRLLVTDVDLDFLSACGIQVRMTPKDAARRKLVTDQ